MKRSICLLLLACLAAVAVFALWEGNGGAPVASPPAENAGTTEGGEEATLVGRGEVAALEPGSDGWTFGVHGIVVDEDGAPVAGMPVLVTVDPRVRSQELLRRLDERFGPPRNAPRVVVETRSAEDGTFQLPGLEPASRYILRAEPRPPRVGEVRIGTGQELAKEEQRLLVVEGSPLRGRVVGANGEGRAAYVSVTMGKGTLAWGSGHGVLDLRDLPTGADGRFLLPALPEGTASLVVRIPRVIQATFFVEVPTGEEVVLRLHVDGGAIVEGTIRDTAGAGIGDARVYVHIHQWSETGALVVDAMAATQRDGRWRIEGLPAGHLAQVHAWAPGFAPAQYQAGSRPLEAGRVETVDFVLSRGAMLEGTVRDPDGESLAGAELTTQVWGPGTYRYATVVADAEGRYALTCLPYGIRTIQIRKDGYYLPIQRDGTQTGDGPFLLRVQVGPEGTRTTLDVVLVRAVPVEGRTIREDGTPLAGVEVTARASTGRNTALTEQLRYGAAAVFSDADGRFGFAGLAPGVIWELTAVSPGWRGSFTLDRLPTPSKGEVSVEIVLEPTASIEGRVLSESGRMVERLAVEVRFGVPFVFVSDDGSFRVSELEAGRYELRVRALGGTHLAEPVVVEVAKGEVVEDVVLRVPDPLPLAGVVVDAAGEPVSAAAVVFRNAGESGYGRIRVRAGADGRFETRVFHPGPYEASIGGSLVEGSWNAGETGLRLVYEPGVEAVLVVHILGPDGKPVPRVDVHAAKVRGTSRTGSTRQVHGGYLSLPRAGLGLRTDLEISRPRGVDDRPLNLRPRIVENVQDVEEAELVVRLEPGLEIRGRIVDEAGDPVSGVRVAAGHERSAWRAQGAVADAVGTFRVVGLDRDTRDIWIHAYPTAPWLPVAPVPVGDRSGEVIVRLVRGHELTVRVLDSEGRPVEGVRVEAAGRTHDRRWQRTGIADGRGEVQLEGIAADAVFDVEVQAGTVSPWPRQAFEDLRFGDGVVEVRLVAGVEIRGEVVDGEGNPLASGSVEAWGIFGNVGAHSVRARLDGGTEFVLGPVVPGRYRVCAHGGREHAPSMYVDVIAPADGIRLVVSHAVKVTGRVFDEAPKGCSVRWYLRDGEQWTSPDVEGRFVIGGLRDEVGALYVVRDATSDACFLREGVKPSDGPFEVRFEDGHSVSGRVEEFRRVGYGPTIGLRRGLLVIGGTIRDDGTFRIRAVPTGRYELVFWVDGREAAVHPAIEAGRTDLVLPMPDVPDASGD